VRMAVGVHVHKVNRIASSDLNSQIQTRKIGFTTIKIFA